MASMKAETIQVASTGSPRLGCISHSCSPAGFPPGTGFASAVDDLCDPLQSWLTGVDCMVVDCSTGEPRGNGIPPACYYGDLQFCSNDRCAARVCRRSDHFAHGCKCSRG